jgi:hypothetical protein
MDWHSPSLFAILDGRDGKALLGQYLKGDFTPVFRALAFHKVRYLIVGGAAMNLHGIPRLTDDLDLFVDLREDNLVRLQAAMEDLGCTPPPSVDPDHILQEESRKILSRESYRSTISFINPEEPGLKVEILLLAPASFNEVYPRRQWTPFGEMELPVLCLDDMIRFLNLYGRDQDPRDIQILEKVREIRGKR